MLNQECVQVALGKDLVTRLLTGLYKGAARKALKVVISVDGSYYIESKELRMGVNIDPANGSMRSIQIHNGKQCAVINDSELKEMGLLALSRDVVKELQDKYSPVFHSLADNIIVFSRAYGSQD